MLDGTIESSPEIPHKSRRTLMSPQECEIVRCSPNQLEMMINFPALASEQCPIPHNTRQMARLPLGNSRDSLRHLSQVEWTPRGPDSKEGTISLQWFKFSLVFHPTR